MAAGRCFGSRQAQEQDMSSAVAVTDGKDERHRSLSRCGHGCVTAPGRVRCPVSYGPQLIAHARRYVQTMTL
jgi:hypothetical protein